MKKIAKKTCAFIVAASSLLSVTACGPEVVGGNEEGKTNISVAIYSGGYGTNWIDGAIERFEKKYENTSFETGKTGVNVIPNKDKSYTGTSLTTMVKNNDAINVYFAGEVPYRELYLDGALLEITDLVKTTVNDQDGKTLESKMTNDYKEFLSENGNYYALPLYEAYNGITYDAGVFKSKKLYFSDKADATTSNKYPGTNAFVTSASDKKSCGPDGVFDTYDDGLPSTYQEFYKLMDKMTLNGVTPFVFSFNSTHYSNNLIISLFENYVGAAGVNALFDYTTNGEQIEIVTGFSGDTPTTTSKALTRENANQIKNSLGMYYASEFAQKVFGNTTNYDTVNTATTHLDAMERFMKSGLDGGNYIGMLLDVLSNLQIESWIIDQYHHIRLPLNNVFFTKVHILEDGTKMQKNRNESHISQIPVMLYQCTTYRLHQIASEKTEISLGILFLQSTHQIGCMEVARSFTYNQIIFHTFKFQVFISQIMP